MVLPIDSCPHAVYRLFDVNNTLLYIGCSISPEPGKWEGSRLQDHKRLQPWSAEIHHMTCEWYPDKPAGLAAEKAAIATENPRHNRCTYSGHISNPSPAVAERRYALHAEQEQKRQEAAERRAAIHARCPRCKGPIDRRPSRHDSYCRACRPQVALEYKLARGWVRKEKRLPKITCSHCGGPRPPGKPWLCKPCRNKYHRDWLARKQGPAA